MLAPGTAVRSLATASEIRDAFDEAMNTLTPSAAASLATAKPMPEEPPMMRMF